MLYYWAFRIFGHISDAGMQELILHCTSDELRSVLQLAVRRGLWNSVVMLLQQNAVHKTDRRWVMKEASKRNEIFVNILPFLSSDEFQAELETFFSRGLWLIISKWLEQTVCETENDLARRSRTYHKKAEDAVISLCNENQLDHLLSVSIEHHLWRAFRALLSASKARQRVIRQAREQSSDLDLMKQVIRHCNIDVHDLDLIAITFARMGLWCFVSELLKSEVSEEQRLQVLIEAGRRADTTSLEKYVIPHCSFDESDNLLPIIVTRRLWYMVGQILGRCGSNYNMKAVEEASIHADQCDFIAHIAPYCHPGQLEVILIQLIRRGMWIAASTVLKIRYPKTPMATKGRMPIRYAYIVRSVVAEIVRRGLRTVVRESVKCILKNVQQMIADERVKAERNANECQLLNPYNVRCTETLMHTFFSEVAKSCLHQIVDILPLDLPEEGRRSLFQVAVEKREWEIVKQLADHSVYDDQRSWAMGKVMYENQPKWEVLMLLADHGLTDDQLRRVYRQIAKHADWHTVLQMFERGADVLLVREELETANPSRARLPTESEMKRYEQKFLDDPGLEKKYTEMWENTKKLEARYRKRCRELWKLEHQLYEEGEDYEQALAQRNWRAVLHKVRRDADPSQTTEALSQAVQSKAWHVVIQIVKLTMNAEQRESFLPEAIRLKQWGVGRVLLECGVSVQLCLDSLPQLIKEGQWLLVARVLEYDISNEHRKRIIQDALIHREGSVVAHGIRIMRSILTVEERVSIFRQCLERGLWQAVRQLVEEVDSTGIAQRDKALIESVWLNRWDVVQHCQQHGANIDKLDNKGNSLAHQAANLGDWTTVEGLMHVGADQFILDKKGFTLLDKAVGSQNWKGAKLMVMFHGDINRPNPEGYTPLNKLIQHEQAEVIDCALDWGRDVTRSAGSKGKTALHIICRAGLVDSIRYMIARGADALAVADNGVSALAFAVTDAHFAQTVIAELIKIGLCTFQRLITDRVHRRGKVYWAWDRNIIVSYSPLGVLESAKDVIDILVSPFERAMQLENLTLMKMLYESGSCSLAELFRLHQHVHLQPPTCRRRAWGERKENIFQYLTHIARNPRSLKSMCRLVISHHVGISKPRIRERKLKKLPLPIPMKNYVSFSDLTDPNFGQ